MGVDNVMIRGGNQLVDLGVHSSWNKPTGEIVAISIQFVVNLRNYYINLLLFAIL